MLGIRTALKPDLECSAAELVYGTTLRIPGDFFGHSQSSGDLDPSDYVQRLRQALTHLRATPPRPSTTVALVSLFSGSVLSVDGRDSRCQAAGTRPPRRLELGPLLSSCNDSRLSSQTIITSRASDDLT
nr:unnamed protein product [Spirometra erinaceieuropaei]